MSVDAALQSYLQEGGLDQAVADLMGRAAEVPGLASRCEQAGIDPAAVASVADLSALPVLPKDAVIALQETGLLAYENGDGAGLVLADGVLVQVCDIATGEPITDETEGEVVVSVLRPHYPLVRFGTGDLSGWMLGPDGSLRLRGVLGRTGAAVKVKGMFLHPTQVASVMGGVEGVADYQFVIGREDHKDTLRCEVVAESGADTDALVAGVGSRVRDGLRFRAEVAVVEALTEGDGPIVDTRDWA